MPTFLQCDQCKEMQLQAAALDWWDLGKVGSNLHVGTALYFHPEPRAFLCSLKCVVLFAIERVKAEAILQSREAQDAMSPMPSDKLTR